MARRDRIGELIAIKERSGRRGGRFPDQRDLTQLKEAWDNWTGSKELFSSLIPARIVTLIEVFCRYWVQKLIDHGSPYDERAIELKTDIKYDLSLVRSLHGQDISLGLLLSNSVKLTSVEAVAAVYSILLQQDFFLWLSDARSRRSIEDEGNAAVPIIKELEQLKRVLARTFEIRHILVHEFPEQSPFSADEVDEMIATAELFITAADEGFTQLIYGLYPLHQQGMNKVAREESNAVEVELAKLVSQVAKDSGSDTIIKVHEMWHTFAKAEADRNAEDWIGGTMYPLLYHSAFKVLASDRLRELQLWLDEFRARSGVA
jgi:hypothetical protein